MIVLIVPARRRLERVRVRDVRRRDLVVRDRPAHVRQRRRACRQRRQREQARADDGRAEGKPTSTVSGAAWPPGSAWVGSCPSFLGGEPADEIAGKPVSRLGIGAARRRGHPRTRDSHVTTPAIAGRALKTRELRPITGLEWTTWRTGRRPRQAALRADRPLRLHAGSPGAVHVDQPRRRRDQRLLGRGADRPVRERADRAGAARARGAALRGAAGRRRRPARPSPSSSGGTARASRSRSRRP